jgi:guanyl-specific ribonuclease Sa
MVRPKEVLSKNKKNLNIFRSPIGLLLLALLAIAVYFQARQYLSPISSGNTGSSERPPITHRGVSSNQRIGNIPVYVIQTLEHVHKYRKAPDGHVGGRTFHNREKKLPFIDLYGDSIRYREWDVKPMQAGKNRGPERLVTGSDGSAWYTRDHYRSFNKIDQ